MYACIYCINPYVPSDYVALAGLQSTELNGVHGEVVECLASGRLRIKLGWQMMGKIVAVKQANVRLVASAADVAAVKKLRDDGLSVADLIKRGFAHATIQRDDSESMCNECYRPRRMCSCTFGS